MRARPPGGTPRTIGLHKRVRQRDPKTGRITRRFRTASRRLTATAHHEAGHGVAAWRLGIRTRRITIHSEGEVAGMHEFEGYLRRARPGMEVTPSIKVKLENTALVLLAGPLAERRYLKRGSRRSGAGNDYEKMIRCLTCLTGEPDELRAYADLMWIRARNFVRSDSNWWLIRAVATELLRRRTLNGPQLRGVIGSALDQYTAMKPGGDNLSYSLGKGRTNRIDRADDPGTADHAVATPRSS